MTGREQRFVCVPELVVACEREADPFAAPRIAALADEFPRRPDVLRVQLCREGADGAVHLLESPVVEHDSVTLRESRL